NIYELYEEFADCYVKDSLTLPSKNEYVSGTLKKWGGTYYYVPVGTWKKCSDCRHRRDKREKDNQLAYYEFCKKLFLKGQTGSLEKALLQSQAAATAGTE